MFDVPPDSAPTAFEPAFGLRSALVQSTLASKRPAAWLWRRRGLDLNALSQFHTLATADETGAPATLTGWHTPRVNAKGLVVLIHGWEGSQDSRYLYGMAASLYTAGYALFRLNLRDHGSTRHDLNVGMFHSARLAEVIGAMQQIQRLAPPSPLFVVGFSLGGNFALRIGLRGQRFGVSPRLSIGISPAINPGSTLRALDDGPAIFHRYFLDKWRLTMDAKAKAFPDQYDFTRHRALRNFTEITRAFVEDYTDFATLDDYLAQYTLTPAMLMASSQPLAIITARDDSVCPPADFAGLEARDGVAAYHATARGGHCGFIENWRLESWAETQVLRLLQQHGQG